MVGIALAGLACGKGTPLCCSALDSASFVLGTSASKVSAGSAGAAMQALKSPDQNHSALSRKLPVGG